MLGGKKLADRLLAAAQPGGANASEKSQDTSTSTNLDDDMVSTGGYNSFTAKVKITEWQVDASSEMFQATTKSRDEAVFRKNYVRRQSSSYREW